jgi:hypothetical protein
MKPRVLMIDGPDIAQRVPLAQRLTGYDVVLAGSAHHDRAIGGFEYHRYPLGRGINPLSIVGTYFRLRKIIATVAPDVVQTFSTSSGIWGRIAAAHEAVPVIVGTINGLGTLYSRGSRTTPVRAVYERLQRYACRVSTTVVFQNGRDLDEMVTLRMVDAGRCVLIPGSGVDVERFHSA